MFCFDRGKKPYTDALNVINPAFELGVCTVDERLWFFKLAHSGQQWCDEVCYINFSWTLIFLLFVLFLNLEFVFVSTKILSV